MTHALNLVNAIFFTIDFSEVAALLVMDLFQLKTSLFIKNLKLPLTSKFNLTLTITG